MRLFLKHRCLLRRLFASLGYAVVLIFAVALIAYTDEAVTASHAVTIDALNPSRVYFVKAIRITGNEHFSASELAAQAQEFYQTYMLNASRFDPHLDYAFSLSLTDSLGYRLEYLKFNQVNTTTIQAIGGFRRNGILSGPNASLIFNNTSDLLNPQNGEILSIGGNLSDHTLGANAILATRLKLGLEDTLNGRIDDVPLSERFIPEERAECAALRPAAYRPP